MFFGDSLRSAIASLNPFRSGYQQPSAAAALFAPQIAMAAYLSSGMLRKVIQLPASDRVREWRDWQAEKDDIEKIEAEERRLGLRAKVKHAEVLRGLGGGALILVTAGDHAQPLAPDTIREGGLIAINVVSRWQLTLKDIDLELASPTYGLPSMFQISNGGRGQSLIHPSRVICFRGDPLPTETTMSAADAFWGDSRLLRVIGEVNKSDNASLWFSELVRKAKLLRVGIANLTDYQATEAGRDALAQRVALIAEGESVLNATVFNTGDGQSPAEQITDYQVTWTGIPAMMDAFDQRVAAVANIPFTVLMGRSPGGMNATGDHDRQNWNREVAAGQNLEVRPCLEAFDAALLRSAGVASPEKVTWRFAPLWTPTEQETATTFKTEMEAITALQNTGAIPDVAFAKGVQNLMAEREYMPGLDQALSEVPLSERFGLNPDDDGSDPSALQAEGGDPASTPAAGVPPAPARRAANDAFFADAQPRPLYVQRKLLNAAELIRWAKANGFTSTLPADDMHVTVLYSRTAVDPMKMGEGWTGDEKGHVRVKPGGPRAIERLGEDAVVLLFASWDIEGRHRSMIEAGGSHDFDTYQPHVTLTYEAPEGLNLDAIRPFTGPLEFGPELFEPLDLDWKSKVSEE